MSTLTLIGLYNYDDTILDVLDARIPTGVYPQALKTAILAECAELEILYTDPTFFKIILDSWSAGRKPVWARMAAALQAEYNITENYDRTEEWTDTGKGDSNVKNKARGYPQDEGLIEQSRTESDGNSSSTHKGRVHGNIGVRSAQELVEQELALADKADLQNYIVQDFKQRFCLRVY